MMWLKFWYYSYPLMAVVLRLQLFSFARHFFPTQNHDNEFIIITDEMIAMSAEQRKTHQKSCTRKLFGTKMKNEKCKFIPFHWWTWIFIHKYLANLPHENSLVFFSFFFSFFRHFYLIDWSEWYSGGFWGLRWWHMDAVTWPGYTIQWTVAFSIKIWDNSNYENV